MGPVPGRFIGIRGTGHGTPLVFDDPLEVLGQFWRANLTRYLAQGIDNFCFYILTIPERLDAGDCSNPVTKPF